MTGSGGGPCKVVGPSGPRMIAVTGATLSGNKGAAAMLQASIFRLSKALPRGSIFRVFTLYPERDRKIRLPEGVTLIPAAPVVTMIFLPIAAIVWRILSPLPAISLRVAKFRPLGALLDCDVLLDLSGISFSDGRGLPTLLFNVALLLPALLCGIPVVKMSQALGPFREPLNRLMARVVLSRMKLVFCRGKSSLRNAETLRLDNCREAADLAFLLEGAEDLEPKAHPVRKLIGIAPSEVLSRKCSEDGIDYIGILEALTSHLLACGFRVLVLAHSNLGPESRSKNNDFRICSELERRLENSGAEFVQEDLGPSQLRDLIGSCDVFIASRFHSMISALCTRTPVVVTSWGHKYAEVMREFGLERYVVPAEELSLEKLRGKVTEAIADVSGITARIADRLPVQISSSRTQIDHVVHLLGAGEFRARAGRSAARLSETLWAGAQPALSIGCAASEDNRSFASGGLVSELLARRLMTGASKAAICAGINVSEGRVEPGTRICRSPGEIFECSGSIYTDFGHLGGIISALRAERGPCDIVSLPCQARALRRVAASDSEVASKIGLMIGLWCGHATTRTLLDDLLVAWRIDTARMKSFKYRTGYWRGATEICLTGGSTVRKGFAHGYGLHQNLYADCARRCLTCTDHFASYADISFGDAWLPEVRQRSRKYSMALQLTSRGCIAMEDLASSGDVILYPADPALAVRSQYRALRWHREGSVGRSMLAALFGLKLPHGPGGFSPTLGDFAAAAMVLTAVKAYSGPLRPLLLRAPWWSLYPYLLIQKGLLSL